MPDDKVEVKLEKVRYAAMQMFTRDMLLEFSTSVLASFVNDMVAARVEAMVYGHRLAQWDMQLEVPKNWWHHLLRTLHLPHKTVVQRASVVRQRIYPDLPVLPQKNAGISYIVEDRA